MWCDYNSEGWSWFFLFFCRQHSNLWRGDQLHWGEVGGGGAYEKVQISFLYLGIPCSGIILVWHLFSAFNIGHCSGRNSFFFKPVPDFEGGGGAASMPNAPASGAIAAGFRLSFLYQLFGRLRTESLATSRKRSRSVSAQRELFLTWLNSRVCVRCRGWVEGLTYVLACWNGTTAGGTLLRSDYLILNAQQGNKVHLKYRKCLQCLFVFFVFLNQGYCQRLFQSWKFSKW